tara:strand:- start:256 stop:471 length:216 start_codon:yes stop_codon:yes gene_type:complete
MKGKPMEFRFVNIPINYKGMEKEQLVAGNTQFSRIWRNLTGKRNATQKQVDALQTLIEEVRTTNNDVQVSQ